MDCNITYYHSCDWFGCAIFGLGCWTTGLGCWACCFDSLCICQSLYFRSSI
ncbi:hypothetical protein ACS0TY_031432 [Phlomoides rotata]